MSVNLGRDPDSATVFRKRENRFSNWLDKELLEEENIINEEAEFEVVGKERFYVDNFNNFNNN